MAKRKSRKQQRIEARDKVASRRFTLITIGVTVALILLVYAMYSTL